MYICVYIRVKIAVARKEEEKWGDLGLDLFVNDTTQP